MQNEKIRQFKRQEVSLRGVLRVDEEDAAQVRFSNTLESALNGKHLKVTVIDIGYGGLGLHTDVFIPRQARFEIEVFKECSGDDSEGGEILLKQEVTAKRCLMVNRDPGYFVGMGFDLVSVDLKSRLDEFMQSHAGDGNDGSGVDDDDNPLTNRGDHDDA